MEPHTLLVSSPLAYPQASSPNEPSPRKRRKLYETRAPLDPVDVNAGPRSLAGFLIDDSDDDEEYLGLIRSDPKRQSGSLQPVGLAPLSIPPAAELDCSLKSCESCDLLDTTAPKSQAHIIAQTCAGNAIRLCRRSRCSSISYEQIVANRSSQADGRARKAFYGVDIHALSDDAKKALDTQTSEPTHKVHLSVATAEPTTLNHANTRPGKTRLWTEKYRARKFTELVGDERTHRSVLKWLKGWDSIVFRDSAKQRGRRIDEKGKPTDEHPHRKLLMLAGPPGLGKTTLAHVCAKQAGYEVQEINASDERSRDVVKGRIKDMVGTENVRQLEISGDTRTRTFARPVCVIVDEVDGVVVGSSGGEGGFIKALVDLMALDQTSTAGSSVNGAQLATKTKKSRGEFRLLRPIILICNDIYHPSLRLLRQGTIAEIVHVRKPAMNMIVPRLEVIFDKEGVPYDSDGLRHLCEAAWGVSDRKESVSSGGTGDGDIRGILVVAEWAAAKLRATEAGSARLTRKWFEQNIASDLAYGGGAARGVGKSGSKDVLERVFVHNAGFASTAAPNVVHVKKTQDSTRSGGVAESARSVTMERLRDIIQASGEADRILTDCFSTYPAHPFQDDIFLTKPNSAYDWLYFHDVLSTAVHESQEWELASYLTHPILAFHLLFASSARRAHTAPAAQGQSEGDDVSKASLFSGVRASYTALEAEKVNLATLQSLSSSLTTPLRRIFRSTEAVATELLPCVLRMLNPDIKPISIGGSGSERGTTTVRRAAEKELISRAVESMIACGVRFERTRIEVPEVAGAAAAASGSGWIYRMEPPLDALGVFETDSTKSDAVKVRYAVRQALEQQWTKEVARREQQARVKRGQSGLEQGGDEHPVSNGAHGFAREVKTHALADDILHVQNISLGMKRDFFGQPVRLTQANPVAFSEDLLSKAPPDTTEAADRGRTWITYREGYSNAVRKGITLNELMKGL